MTTKPPILVARAVFPETIAFLRQHFDVTDNQADEVWARPDLISRLQGIDRIKYIQRHTGISTTGIDI